MLGSIGWPVKFMWQVWDEYVIRVVKQNVYHPLTLIVLWKVYPGIHVSSGADWGILYYICRFLQMRRQAGIHFTSNYDFIQPLSGDHDSWRDPWSCILKSNTVCVIYWRVRILKLGMVVNCGRWLIRQILIVCRTRVTRWSWIHSLLVKVLHDSFIWL